MAGRKPWALYERELILSEVRAANCRSRAERNLMMADMHEADAESLRRRIVELKKMFPEKLEEQA